MCDRAIMSFKRKYGGNFMSYNGGGKRRRYHNDDDDYYHYDGDYRSSNNRRPALYRTKFALTGTSRADVDVKEYRKAPFVEIRKNRMYMCLNTKEYLTLAAMKDDIKAMFKECRQAIKEYKESRKRDTFSDDDDDVTRKRVVEVPLCPDSDMSAGEETTTREVQEVSDEE